MKTWAKQSLGAKGFTIVELLIVVVVIAILATISVVAFRGIQEQARTASVAAAVDQWQKLIMNEVAKGVAFPATATYCLGSSAADFPAGDGFAAGECFQELDNGTSISSFSYGTAFFQNWSAGIARPNGLLPITSYKYDSSTTFRARGAWVSAFGFAPQDLYLRWIPQVAEQCGRGKLVVAVPGGNSSLDGSWCEITIKR